MTKTRIIRNIIALCMIVLFGSTLFSLHGCRRGFKDSETMLIGVITDVQEQIPVSRVQIEIRNTSTGKTFKGSSDQQGRFKIFSEAGYFELKATHPRYLDYTRNIVLGKGSNQEDFYMSPVLEKPCVFEGTVTAEDTSKPIENVTVQIGTSITKTDSKGRFKFDALPLGSFPVWVTTPGYQAINETVVLAKGSNSVKYVLKKLDLADIGKPVESPERNKFYAIDPTFLGDYRAHSIRTIKPMDERHEYRLISETRHRKHLYYDEHVDKGEVMYIDDAMYIKFLDRWQVPEQIHTSHRPEAFLAEDITMVIYYFNFADVNFEIKELGSEKMNGYNTRKFHLYHLPSAPPEKQIDVHLWVIHDENNPRTHRMITRIKGKMPEVFNLDTWAEVETNITHINQGNKIEIPKIHTEANQ